MVPCMGFKPMISTLERRVCLIATPTRDILIGRPRGDRTHDKRIKSPLLYQLSYRSISGGRSGIRTHGRLSPTSVFKTGALNHSATLPLIGRRCRIRTCDPLLPKQMRYQTALISVILVGPSTRYRSLVSRLSVECSTFELSKEKLIRKDVCYGYGSTTIPFALFCNLISGHDSYFSCNSALVVLARQRNPSAVRLSRYTGIFHTPFLISYLFKETPRCFREEITEVISTRF